MAPYLWSFLHTPTRSLAFVVGSVKTSSNHAAGLSGDDALIALDDIFITPGRNAHKELIPGVTKELANVFKATKSSVAASVHALFSGIRKDKSRKEDQRYSDLRVPS
jgi:hypothetical protein